MQCCTPANKAPGRASSSAQQGAFLPEIIKFAASSCYGAALFPLVPSDAGQGLLEIQGQRSCLWHEGSAVLPSDRHAINKLQEVRPK